MNQFCLKVSRYCKCWKAGDNNNNKKKYGYILLWTNYSTLLQKVENSFKAHSFPSHTRIPLKNVKLRSFSGKSSHFRDQNTDFCFEVGTVPRGTLQSTGGVRGCSVPAGAVPSHGHSSWTPLCLF